MSITSYCSQTDLQNLMSPIGLINWADDDGDGVADPLVVAAVIQHASHEYNRYVRKRYPVSRLAPSGVALDAVRLDTSILAAYRLCTRRGNPAPGEIEAARLQAIEFLKLVQGHQANIPEAVLSEWDLPRVRNFGTDLRFRTATQRVQKEISNTPDTTLRRHTEVLVGPW